MKTLTLSLIACLMLGAFGGCATAPTTEQLANADYGAPIPEEEATAKAEQFVLDRMKDPESARFEPVTFGRGYAQNGILHGGGFEYGYLLEIYVNARNSFGGYVGDRQYRFIFRDGEIAAAWGETPLTGGGTYMQRLK